MHQTNETQALVNDPVQVLVLLCMVVFGALWLFSNGRFNKLSRILPAPIWIYIVPVSLTSLGILPSSSPLYSALGMLLVPTSLFLLTVSADFRATLKIGHMAAVMLAAGTTGIILGGILAYLSIQNSMPSEAWKGFAVLSGAWIGGSANAVAVQQGLQADPAVIGPLLIVDSMLGYGWVAFLLFLAGRQTFLSKLFGYQQDGLTISDSVEIEKPNRREFTAIGAAKVLFIVLLASAAAAGLGMLLPELGEPKIVTATTWTILIIVFIGVSCSFTRLRELEKEGASDYGYLMMLILLASLGARGDFRAFLDAPIYLLSGAIWLTVHLIVLAVVARLVKAPPVLFALGSVANIGGFVTAPIIAAAYDRNFVPTALLMAAVAQAAGIYLPFFFATIIVAL